MKLISWSNLLVGGSSLLAGVLAGRFSEVAHRKGFTEAMIRERQARDLEDRATVNASEYRFYNSNTKKYFVESLPEIPQSFMTEMYSGLVPIDTKNKSRALYFVFTPTVGKPVDTLTIWLNGGPGCSSLEGFFQENGRIIWGWGMFSPEINPYAWSNLTNVLWVEQPVGTGFSTGEATATTEEEIAEDFVNFLANFQEIFGIKNFEIYVTGESYAGRYVPYIASAMLDRNDTKTFNISGALAYDPVIGSYVYSGQEAVAVPFVMENNNVLGLNKSFVSTLEKLDKSCGFAEYRETYYKFPPNETQPEKYFNQSGSDADCDVWGMIYRAAYSPNPCFNVYEVGLQCPILGDVLGLPSDLAYSYAGVPVYFNRTDVKKAMHAPDVDWVYCNGPIFVGEGGPEDEGDLSADPIQKVLPRVIEATNRVLIANGDLDLEIITNGTLLSIQNMTWGGKLGFQKKPSKPIVIKLPDLQYEATFVESGFPGWDDPQGTMGIQHYERGLMWAETFLCGHMQPQFQPRSSYRHLQWLLRHIETL